MDHISRGQLPLNLWPEPPHLNTEAAATTTPTLLTPWQSKMYRGGIKSCGHELVQGGMLSTTFPGEVGKQSLRTGSMVTWEGSDLQISLSLIESPPPPSWVQLTAAPWSYLTSGSLPRSSASHHPEGVSIPPPTHAQPPFSHNTP